MCISSTEKVFVFTGIERCWCMSSVPPYSFPSCFLWMESCKRDLCRRSEVGVHVFRGLAVRIGLSAQGFSFNVKTTSSSWLPFWFTKFRLNTCSTRNPAPAKGHEQSSCSTRALLSILKQDLQSSTHCLPTLKSERCSQSRELKFICCDSRDLVSMACLSVSAVMTTEKSRPVGTD